MTSEDKQGSIISLDKVIGIVAISMIVYHILSVWTPMFNALLHQNIHLGFSIALLFLAYMQTGKKWGKLVFAVSLVLSLICIVYVHVEYERLRMFAGWPERIDLPVGVTLVLVVTYLTWKEWGYIFPFLVGFSVLYALLGHHLKGSLGHPYIELSLIISNLSIGFEGIYGMMLNASADLIFLFIIFGSMFEAVGIDKFFLSVGTFLGKHLRGGAAQTAVFSSSFVGMSMGVAPANVALTGSYTIPLMIRTGFKPEYASAIEAVASTGGQLTPPVMGVAVFLMASFLGTSYASLMATAFVPAVIFYITVFFGVILMAKRENISMLTAKASRKDIIAGAPLFIIPMGLVVVLLMFHFTPAYVAMYAIVSLLVIAMLRAATRPSIKGLVSGLIKGAKIGASIAVACATLGMFTKMMVTTGAAQKLAGLIQLLSGGHLIVGLFLTMLLSILLGCALPTVVAYVLVALIVSPVLVDMGLNQMIAHFFVFYYAILANVTPPVAAATLVGSKIAGGSYNRASWESLKLSAPFYLVPFFIARNPIVLSQRQPFMDALLAILALIIACGAFLVFCQNFCFSRLSPLERAGFMAVTLLATYFGQFGNFLTLILATIIAAIFFSVQWKKRNGTSILVSSENNTIA